MKDYDLLLPGVPASLISLDAGHMGTYMSPNGGKICNSCRRILRMAIQKKRDSPNDVPQLDVAWKFGVEQVERHHEKHVGWYTRILSPIPSPY